MANEATLLVETTIPVNYTVIDSLSYEKGALLKLIDPDTVSGANSLQGAKCAGVVAVEKVANSGITKISIYEEGDFKFSLSGACAVGDALMMDATPNYVRRAQNVSGASILGYSKETGANNDTIKAKLRISPGGSV